MMAGSAQSAASVAAPKTEQKPTTGAGANSAPSEPPKQAERSMTADLDDKIDDLFNLGGSSEDMGMSYDLGNSDNSNFNDMYFGTSNNGGGSEEFDESFFNLEG